MCLWRSRGSTEITKFGHPGKTDNPPAQDEGQQVGGEGLAKATRWRTSTKDSYVKRDREQQHGDGTREVHDEEQQAREAAHSLAEDSKRWQSRVALHLHRFGLECPRRWDPWEYHTGSAIRHHTGHRAERDRHRDRDESVEFAEQIATSLLRYSVYDVAAADVRRRDCKNVADRSTTDVRGVSLSQVRDDVTLAYSSATVVRLDDDDDNVDV